MEVLPSQHAVGAMTPTEREKVDEALALLKEVDESMQHHVRQLQERRETQSAVLSAIELGCCEGSCTAGSCQRRWRSLKQNLRNAVFRLVVRFQVSGMKACFREWMRLAL